MYVLYPSCFSEEIHDVQILRPNEQLSMFMTFQILLELSMEYYYYIKAMSEEALIIFFTL